MKWITVPLRLPWVVGLPLAVGSAIIGVHLSYLPYMAFGVWRFAFGNFGYNLALAMIAGTLNYLGTGTKWPWVPVFLVVSLVQTYFIVFMLQTQPVENYIPWIAAIPHLYIAASLSYVFFASASHVRSRLVDERES